MAKTPDFELLSDAKQYCRDGWEKGVGCPCCGQLVKLYKRKFNSGMARILIHFYNVQKLKPEDDNWVMVSRELLTPTMNPTNMEYSKLAHWKLIESRGDEGEHTPSAGYWRLTQRGIRFVTGDSSIPSHIHIYNNIIVGYSDTQVTIREALGENFDYEELMKA